MLACVRVLASQSCRTPPRADPPHSRRHAPAGIGQALAVKCAMQGMNVVLVARPEPILDDAYTALCKEFPKLEFRQIPVDLSARGSDKVVADGTADLPISVCFLNAGYVQTGFFNQTPLEKHFANLECNVGHVIALSHLFTNRRAHTWRRDRFRGSAHVAL